jgi:hypothetical protein
MRRLSQQEGCSALLPKRDALAQVLGQPMRSLGRTQTAPGTIDGGLKLEHQLTRGNQISPGHRLQHSQIA